MINRSPDQAIETTISLVDGRFAGNGQAFTVNGPDVKAENSFDAPDKIHTQDSAFSAEGKSFNCTFEPHSVMALNCPVS